MSSKKNKFKPESEMMSYGYKPDLSEGAIKCPVFQTSTFEFKSAEEGKAFFELALGRKKKSEEEEPGLIYSRLNNPNTEILEDRLCLWDKAEDCVVLGSGMSAISFTLLEFLKPGALLVHSGPLYAGIDHLIKNILTKYNIETLEFNPGISEEELEKQIKDTGKSENLSMIYVETPANPTNSLIDIQSCKKVAKRFSNEEKEVIVAVDNTYLGPLFQKPLSVGADISLYSATKYIGGHSDLVAGACLGSKELIELIKTLRSFLGSMVDPWTAWLLMRSLETLKPRMKLQAKNAKKIAEFLNDHTKIEKVYYLGFLNESTPEQYNIYKKQCISPGAMLSFDIKGGEKEAFRFLNSLKLLKLAVSLGSTESLAEHPYTMTHVEVNKETKDHFNITDKMIRLSVGVEDKEDLVSDLDQALANV
ncbi:MAG: cystathionine gamma-synthase family protein [Flavobacteriales bacterium]